MSGISRSVLRAPPVRCLRQQRTLGIIVFCIMSQYLVCMHDESLIEYTEERREARVKLLLHRSCSTRASEIDREIEIGREVARSLVSELSSRGVQAKSVADLSLGSDARVTNRVHRQAQIEIQTVDPRDEASTRSLPANSRQQSGQYSE